MIPALLGWDYARLDDELRKSFEVALHAGTAAALLLVLRGELRDTLDVRRLGLVALSTAPPAIAGYALERPIERSLGTPATIAAGLLAGAGVMAWADRAPQTRSRAQAGTRDALCLGIAQACALMPGVSRGGATLAAARLRRFRRPDASRLSREVGLPVIAGATLLRAIRLRREALPPGFTAAFAAGAAAAFAATLVSARLIQHVERDRSPAPYALYRTGLAVLILRKLGRSTRSRRMKR